MVRTINLTSRIIAFTLLALAALVLLGSQAGQAEDYREIGLYLENPSPGNLVHEAPDSGTPTEVDMDTNPSGQNQYAEVGTWSTRDLTKLTNVSGAWSFSMWAMPDQNIDLDLRVTLRRAGGDITTLNGETSIPANQDGEVTATGNVPLTEWGNNAIEIFVESRWDYTPPATGTLSSLKFRFDSTSLDAHITVSLSYIEVGPGREVDHNEATKTVRVYAQIDSSFGTEPLTKEAGDYEMEVSWEGDSATLTSSAPTTSDEGYQVRFEWNYEGKSLPAGDNFYTAEITVIDGWLRETWTGEFDFEMYVTPVPNLEMEATVDTKNIKPGETIKFSITVKNTGTGPAPIELTTEDTLVDEDWKASLDKSKFELAAGDDTTVRLSITAPDTGEDGDQDFTRVIAITNDSFDQRQELIFTSNLKVPPPRYDLILAVEGEQSKTSWDLSAVTYNIRVFNEGNREDSFTLQVEDNPGGLNIVFQPTRITDLEPDGSGVVTVTITPREAFIDGVEIWPHTVEIVLAAKSEADNLVKKSTIVELVGDFSTKLVIEGSSADIEIKQDKTGQGKFAVINRNEQASLEIFFEADFPDDVAGKPITTNRLKFYDDAGDEIDDDNLITIGPASSVQISYRLTVPDWAAANVEHEIEIRALDVDEEYVSSVGLIKLTTLKGEEEDNSVLLMGVGILGVVILVSGGLFILRPWESDELDEDDLDILDADLPVADMPDELPSTLADDEDDGPAKPTGIPSLAFDSSEQEEPEAPPTPEAPPSLPDPVPPLGGPAPFPDAMAPPVPPMDGGLPPAPGLPPLGQPPLPGAPPAPDMGGMLPLQPPMPGPATAPPLAPMPGTPEAAPPMMPPPMAPVPPLAPQPAMAPPMPAAMPPPAPAPMAPAPVAPAPVQPVAVEPVVVAAEPVVVEPVVVAAEPVVVAAEPVAVVVVAEEQ